jgi:hypothetical protein
MAETVLARATGIFRTRLETLGRLLDTAAAQWRERTLDPETLLASRLAPDMLPLPHQIVFACNQPNDLAAWCTGSTTVRTEPGDLAFPQLKQHVEATIGRLTEATEALADDVLLREKRVELREGAYLVLPGQIYIEDWLMPNFYFHLVTAYDVLRHEGVRIGKADYMAHLAPRVRRPGQD